MTDIDELKRLAEAAGFEAGEHITWEDVICTEEVAKLVSLVRAEQVGALEALRAELEEEKINRQTAELGYKISADTCVRLHGEMEEARKDADKWQRESIYLEGLLDGVETDMRRFLEVRAARQQTEKR